LLCKLDSNYSFREILLGCSWGKKFLSRKNTLKRKNSQKEEFSQWKVSLKMKSPIKRKTLYKGRHSKGRILSKGKAISKERLPCFRYVIGNKTSIGRFFQGRYCSYTFIRFRCLQKRCNVHELITLYVFIFLIKLALIRYNWGPIYSTVLLDCSF